MTPPDRQNRDRALDEIFGEILPSTTSDERDPDPRNDNTDDWYERERPPHHDRD